MVLKLSLLAGTAALLAGVLFHTELKSSIPAKGASVTSPAKISLTFTEGVNVAVSGIAILKSDSTEVEKLSVAKGATSAVIEGVVAKPLAPGKYLVRYKTAAEDGHAARGTFGFTVVAK